MQNTPIESEEFPLLVVCDSIFIYQDEDNKNIFKCYFNNYETKFSSTLELTRSEVERLEHTLIASSKAKVAANIQYVPWINGIEL